MKGLSFAVGLVILSITTNAQRIFYTSETGIAEYNADSSGWIYNNLRPSNLKIYVSPKSITINDEKKSTYTLLSENPGIREVDGASVESWSALDVNGKPCYITLTTYKNGPVQARISFFYNIHDKRRIYYNATEAL